MGGLSHRQKAVANDPRASTDDHISEQQGTILSAPINLKTYHTVKKTPKMLENLASSLEDPPSKGQAPMTSVFGLIHDDAMYMTRSSTRGLTNLANGKPLSPTKNYNLKELVRKQETREAQPELKKEENRKRKKAASGKGSSEQKYSDSMSLLEVMANRGDDLNIRDTHQSRQPLNQDHTRKDEIIKRLLAPQYKLSSRKAPHPSVPEGFNMDMEGSLFVFRPEARVFSDFTYFLSVVEDIAGRLQGVVKVVLPTSTDTTTWGSPSPSRGTVAEDNRTKCAANESLNNGSLPVTMKTYKTRLVAHKLPRSNITFAYGTETRADRNVLASVWRDKIEVHRMETANSWSIDIDQEGGTWKEAVYENTFGEEHMVHALAKHVLHTLNIEAKQDIRAALRCIDIGLENFGGNRLFNSRSRIPAIHSSQFQVSKTPGAVFGLRMNEYAAYLLSVLHVGPPRRWVVVKPTHHVRLEEILFNILHGSGRSAHAGGNQDHDIPQCSQFIKHEALYLPVQFLENHQIEYTLVIQHQSEMVITFPFAYHQEFDTGPNINESILYASKRWEFFITRELYVPCNDMCPGSPIHMEFNLRIKSRRATSKRYYGSTPNPVGSRAKKPAKRQDTPKRKRVETQPATVDRQDDEDEVGEVSGIDSEMAESTVAGGARKKRRLVKGGHV